jgi:hypothetical protein
MTAGSDLPLQWWRDWRHPSAILLLVQLAGVFIYPFMDDSPVGRAALSLFSLVVLFLAVRTVRTTPALSWVAILLGLPIIVLTLLEMVAPEDRSVLLASSGLHAAFYFYTTFALMAYMFQDHDVTVDELWATGATFTVLAWAFAYAFAVVELLWPGSFSVGRDTGAPTVWFELLFLSFTTLTSVGLSDIVPQLPQGRSLVMIGEVAGLMYVALVISRVVGLTIARQRI